MNSFQKTGLTAAIRAVEDIDRRGGGEGDRCEVSHICHSNFLKKGHLFYKWSYQRRIGITT